MRIRQEGKDTSMKGQRLFIRPIETTDRDALAAFAEVHAPGSPIPACGLLAKLVGDLAAVIAFNLDRERDVQITNLIVAGPLRRKRIGRAIVEEAAVVAARLDRNRLVVTRGTADGYFVRIGFIESGAELIRRVG